MNKQIKNQMLYCEADELVFARQADTLLKEKYLLDANSRKFQVDEDNTYVYVLVYYAINNTKEKYLDDRSLVGLQARYEKESGKWVW